MGRCAKGKKGMIKIAVPYTGCFKEKEKEILECVDVVELKTADESMYETNHKKIFHWNDGIIDHDFRDKIHDQGLIDLFKREDISYFSLDFAPSCERVRTMKCQWGSLYVPDSDILSPEELHAVVERNLGELRKYFSGDVAIETMNYYGTGAYENICIPEIIADIVRKHDLFLLLDMGHVQISCANMKIDMKDYIDRLPLEKLKEVHLSRSEYIDSSLLPIAFQELLIKEYGALIPEVMYDAHNIPTDEMIADAFNLLKRSNVDERIITVEFYKDSSALLECYRALWAQRENVS